MYLKRLKQRNSEFSEHLFLLQNHPKPFFIFPALVSASRSIFLINFSLQQLINQILQLLSAQL
jgi:hypothetical protein